MEVVVGTGYIIKDVSFNIVSDAVQKITSNLDLKLDFSLRDNQTAFVVFKKVLTRLPQVSVCLLRQGLHAIVKIDRSLVLRSNGE